MPTYYAVVPGHEELAMEVKAPNKRHARTVYLTQLYEDGISPILREAYIGI
jgi:hypothetical protein